MRVRAINGLYECGVCGVRSTASRSATIFDDAYYQRHYETGERAGAYGEVAGLIAGAVAPGARVLDVGCGVGHLVVALRELGYDAVGVDPSEAARRAASKHDVDACETIRDVADEPFAAVFLVDVVAHVGDARALAAEAIGALAPDGLVVVRTPAVTSALVDAEAAITLGGRIGGSPLLHRAGRVHHFDRSSLRRVFTLWGLRVVEVRAVQEPIVVDEAHPIAGTLAQWLQRSLTGGGSLLAIGYRR
jgi:SAM-dependent methyltransferase